MFSLILALTLAAPTPKETKAAPPSIVGYWKMQEKTVGGRKEPPFDLTYEFTADGKLYMRETGQKELHESAYIVNDKTSPAEYGWIPTPGNDPVPGIYKVDKDTLTICGVSGKETDRPKAFDSPAGSGYVLMVFRRVKTKH